MKDRTTCSECTSKRDECAWCENTRQCLNFAQYVPLHLYGQCQHWVYSKLQNIQCHNCSIHFNYSTCLDHFGCGWCYNEHNPTIGVCLDGDFVDLSSNSQFSKMNRIPDRKRFLPRQFYKSDKYRGASEPISMMSMDFQGRYFDSQGRMLDPKVSESYRRYHFDGQNYPGSGPSGSQNYTWGAYPGGHTKADWYRRSPRHMVFPERFMDLSNYQMDLKGRWMDMQGRYINPFSSKTHAGRNNFPSSSPQAYSNNYSNFMSYPESYKDTPGYQMDSQGRLMRQTNPFSYNEVGFHGRPNLYKYPPYMQNTWRFMSWPERYTDMTGYQMDMNGRWMDTQGRYCNPFNQEDYNKQSFYPGNPHSRNMAYPEKMMNMPNYHMDTQGRSDDRYGRRVNPFSGHSCRICRNMNHPYQQKMMDMSKYQMDTQGRYGSPFSFSSYNRQGSFPSFPYSHHMAYPEKMMDMSNYQMDMQGRWMDMQGRYRNPFSFSGYNRQGSFPGFQYSRNLPYPENTMDMSNYQMDMQGRWMDMQGRYRNPFSFSGYNRQGSFPGLPYSHNFPYSENMMDMSNYQMDMQGRWMDMQGRYKNPFSFSGYNRQGSFPDFPYSRNLPYPENTMDMSNYQMDMEGRWMDMQGRYKNPFSFSGYNRQGTFPSFPYSHHMAYPEKMMNMSNYQMDMQGRWMDMQGRYKNPFSFSSYNRQGSFPSFPYSHHMAYPEKMMDMSNYQMDMQGRWMDMQGRYRNPFSFSGYNRQGSFHNFPYSHHTAYPEKMMDMSNYQMDMQGRWMDTQGRYKNPFSFSGYNRQGSFPGFQYSRNLPYPENTMDMSNYQMDMQGRWMDTQGRYRNPFSFSGYNRQESFPGLSHSHHMPYPENMMDMSNYQMDMQGRWMDMQGRYRNPFSFSGYNRQGSFPGFPYSHHKAYPEKMMDMSNYQMDMEGRWMDTQGRYRNPFSFSGYNRQGSFPGFPYSRNLPYPEKMTDMSNYQMDTQGHSSNPFNKYSNYNNYDFYPDYSYDRNTFPERSMDDSANRMDIQGRYNQPSDYNMSSTNIMHPFYNYRYSRSIYNPERYMDTQEPSMDMEGGFYPGYQQGRNMSSLDRSVDLYNPQMDTEGRWVDDYSEYAHPGGQGRQFGDYFRSTPGTYHGDTYKYFGTRNMYDRDQSHHQYEYNQQPTMLNSYSNGYYGNNMMGYFYDN